MPKSSQAQRSLIVNAHNPNPSTKKVKYIISIIYLLVLAIIVAGSYINQHNPRGQNKVPTIKESQKEGGGKRLYSDLLN